MMEQFRHLRLNICEDSFSQDIKVNNDNDCTLANISLSCEIDTP